MEASTVPEEKKLGGGMEGDGGSGDSLQDDAGEVTAAEEKFGHGKGSSAAGEQVDVE